MVTVFGAALSQRAFIPACRGATGEEGNLVNVSMRKFNDLSERGILALAISNEEEDARIYADFSGGLHEDYPATAKVFAKMAAEENTDRRRLIHLFVSKFSDHIPLVHRQDV
jgi:erythrin-vacuolar iron transport family protein